MTSTAMRAAVGISPGPLADTTHEKINTMIGTSTTARPVFTITFFIRSSSAPFDRTIANRSVTPASVKNNEPLNPAMISFPVNNPLPYPRMTANRIAITPTLIFRKNPIKIANTNNNRDIPAIPIL